MSYSNWCKMSELANSLCCCFDGLSESNYVGALGQSDAYGTFLNLKFPVRLSHSVPTELASSARSLQWSFLILICSMSIYKNTCYWVLNEYMVFNGYWTLVSNWLKTVWQWSRKQVNMISNAREIAYINIINKILPFNSLLNL